MAMTMAFDMNHQRPHNHHHSWNQFSASLPPSQPVLQNPWGLPYCQNPETMEFDDPFLTNGNGIGIGNGANSPPRKRKAESQDSDRLCKRVGLLNLDQKGQRIYVPVESTPAPPPSSPPRDVNLTQTSMNPALEVPPAPLNSADAQIEAEMSMRVDDTRHKVYIYDLDAELSSSSDDEAHADENGIMFLPDIDKHLRSTRIPKAVLRPDENGMYAGKDVNEMQLVLYGAPKSVSLPEDKDNVRRAIIEARHRAQEESSKVQERIREAQRRVRETYPPAPTKDVLNGMGVGGMAARGSLYTPPPQTPPKPAPLSSGFGPSQGFRGEPSPEFVLDDDAMDLDL